MGFLFVSALYFVGAAVFYALATKTAEAEPMSVGQLRVIETEAEIIHQRAA